MEFKIKPWSHQLKVIKELENHIINSYALFHDMG